MDGICVRDLQAAGLISHIGPQSMYYINEQRPAKTLLIVEDECAREVFATAADGSEIWIGGLVNSHHFQMTPNVSYWKRFQTLHLHSASSFFCHAATTIRRLQ